jgi:NADPH-dependent glutamate synthase beta subunit-like oxidoreductase
MNIDMKIAMVKLNEKLNAEFEEAAIQRQKFIAEMQMKTLDELQAKVKTAWAAWDAARIAANVAWAAYEAAAAERAVYREKLKEKNNG